MIEDRFTNLANEYDVPVKKVKGYWDRGKKAARKANQGSGARKEYPYATAVMMRSLQKTGNKPHSKNRVKKENFDKIIDKILSTY